MALRFNPASAGMLASLAALPVEPTPAAAEKGATAASLPISSPARAHTTKSKGASTSKTRALLVRRAPEAKVEYIEVADSVPGFSLLALRDHVYSTPSSTLHSLLPHQSHALVSGLQLSLVDRLEDLYVRSSRHTSRTWSSKGPFSLEHLKFSSRLIRRFCLHLASAQFEEIALYPVKETAPAMPGFHIVTRSEARNLLLELANDAGNGRYLLRPSEQTRFYVLSVLYDILRWHRSLPISRNNIALHSTSRPPCLTPRPWCLRWCGTVYNFRIETAHDRAGNPGYSVGAEWHPRLASLLRYYQTHDLKYTSEAGEPGCLRLTSAVTAPELHRCRARRSMPQWRALEDSTGTSYLNVLTGVRQRALPEDYPGSYLVRTEAGKRTDIDGSRRDDVPPWLSVTGPTTTEALQSHSVLTHPAPDQETDGVASRCAAVIPPPPLAGTSELAATDEDVSECLAPPPPAFAASPMQLAPTATKALEEFEELGDDAWSMPPPPPVLSPCAASPPPPPPRADGVHQVKTQATAAGLVPPPAPRPPTPPALLSTPQSSREAVPATGPSGLLSPAVLSQVKLRPILSEQPVDSPRVAQPCTMVSALQRALATRRTALALDKENEGDFEDDEEWI
ncbi:uncharacterized protein MONBRDRAFT_8176 [Monosiga brevicollis MX1]|uniref:SH2 domain-containing protein n=1 Tax=Monosiga brevicollis TaxID=81824 RepID=A9UZ96_MONBE|nr:uncharacterized protein MONBRDRAFT_8176 [Monosiga brevicollis MX1]EDQ89329.1 predicted protein [Monosiga brevicollis MX1]|eukprot:XP_001745905.1 hypothetical protein [Monosiga brevicollis MX1]